MLGDDHSHMGGSGDMKSDVAMVEIVLIVDFIFMFLCLDFVLYIVGYYKFYISHILGWIVLYPRCRVNRDTNLSVVCDYVILLLLPLCAFWAPCDVPNLWGASPLSCSPLRTMMHADDPSTRAGTHYRSAATL